LYQLLLKGWRIIINYHKRSRLMSITESSSPYQDLEKLALGEVLKGINREDQKVALAVSKKLDQITSLIEQVVVRMKSGGRIFYIGAGTSGRLGILDASECPPTFGVDHDVVIGIIAGGDGAIRKAVEFAEDDDQQAWKDLSSYQPSAQDSLIGLAASGTTPYVLGGVRKAKKQGLLTGCIVCNPESALAQAVEFPIEIVMGPEYVTGSTRMKAGTAQKLVLNMISTTVMIQLGRVKGNKMVDMQLSNDKLIDRGIKMIVMETGLDRVAAAALLNTHSSVRKAIDGYNKS
jgi:N-acetylmuramic acid 6-phosphate etherase